MSGQRAHPGAEAIAGYQAGVADGLVFWRAFRRRRLAAHLGECQQCASLAQQISQVSAVLASAPRPAMPTSVAERLTAALAAEVATSEPGTAQREPARLLAAGNGHGSVPGRDPGGPGRGGRPGRGRRPRLPRRVLVPATVTVLVVAGGGYLISQQHSESPVVTPASLPRASGSGTTPTSGVELAPDHVGAGRPTMNYRVISTGTDYRAGTLRAEVSREIRTSARIPVALAPVNLAGCVSHVAGGSRVLFVDLARYEGRPAFVIASDGRAWVTGPTCSDTSSDLLASVHL